jgi:diguanylate cyclase (GGDEF)-like protein
MLFATVVFLVLVVLLAGWPYFRLDDPAASLLVHLAPLMLVPWALALGAALWARKGAPESRVLMHATVQLYAISIALFTLTIGPFHSPGWIAFNGGVVVGYLLFERVAALFGVVTYLVIVIGGAWILITDAWPLLERLVPFESYVYLSRAAVVRLAVTSCVPSAFTLASSAYIIERWRDREARYQRLARTDSLTQLTNRRTFIALAERELVRARRYRTPLAVVLCDLDHFKRINDTRGHQAGDRVLVHAARTLTQAVRDVDTVARWGGEEFALLLPETDLQGAREVAERCARLLAGATIDLGEGEPVGVTGSFGVAAGPDGDDAGLDALIRRADDALYRAKDAGRNRVEVAPVVSAA